MDIFYRIINPFIFSYIFYSFRTWKKLLKRMVKEITASIINKQPLLVSLDGKLFDITEFAPRHPGIFILKIKDILK